jgi:hypothetical protein
MKIRAVGAELFHADGQTSMAKLTVAFRSFANALKKEQILHNSLHMHTFSTVLRFKTTSQRTYTNSRRSDDLQQQTIL